MMERRQQQLESFLQQAKNLFGSIETAARALAVPEPTAGNRQEVVRDTRHFKELNEATVYYGFGNDDTDSDPELWEDKVPPRNKALEQSLRQFVKLMRAMNRTPINNQFAKEGRCPLCGEERT